MNIIFRKVSLIYILFVLMITAAGSAHAALGTINISPANPALDIGVTQIFTASGMNEDGSPSTLFASMVSVSYDHSCAMTVDGRVQCWGYNYYGQLGNGTRSDTRVPVIVEGISSAVEISAGYTHNCALLSDGTIQCWGRNDQGQLGNGTLDDSSIPVTVTGISNAMHISSGYSQSCALLSDSTVQCWGRTYGDTTYSTTPVSIPGIDTATEISAGNGNGCARLADGTVQCWGYNSQGQLGNGTNDASVTPVPVTGITSAVSISSGMTSHSCARLADDTVKCWGYNANGQLGNGTQKSSNIPIPVAGVTAVKSIVAGDGNTCAVLTDGTMQCWGNNYFGQFGDGSKNSSFTPVPIAGVNMVDRISIGRLHSCIQLNDGTVQCTGNNGRGELGNPSLTETLVPVTITGFPEGLSWSSSNPAVATIDASGVATSLSGGTTTITATSGLISGSTTLTVVATTFNLTITTSGTGSGTVTGGGIYNYGATASISAIPDAGSILKGWIGPNGEECATGSVLMTAEKSCNAIFHIPTPPPACEALPYNYEYVGDLDVVAGFSRMAMGPSGKLYVTDYNGQSLHIYNQGRLIKSISVSSPRAVAVADSGEIFVATGQSIKGFTINPDDTVSERIAVANATYYDTNGLAVSSDGRFFAYDGIVNQAQVYGADGTLITYLGKSIIKGARGIAIDDANRRIIVTQGTYDVLIFDLDNYSLLDRFGSLRMDGLAEGLYFDFIQGVNIDKAGRIYIADSVGNVYIADACYNYLNRIGGYYVWNSGTGTSELVKGRPDGRLDFPVDIVIDNSGLMYVSTLNGRVAIFANNSSVKRTIAGRGTDTVDRIESYDADGVSSMPFTGYSSTGSTKVASGDINGDGIDEVMTVPGVSNLAAPELKIFNQDGTEWLALRTLPFGSVSVVDMGVASADFNNDGRDEVIVWSGGSGQPVAIKIYSYDSVLGSLVETGVDLFYSLGDSLLRVAAGDVNGDGKEDLITLVGRLSGNGTKRTWSFYIWNVNTDSGPGSWTESMQKQFAYVLAKKYSLEFATGNMDDDIADEMSVAVWDSSIPDSNVTIYLLEGTGSLAGNFSAGITDALGVSIASANMDGLDRDEIFLMLHDETGDLGIVKVLRTDGKVMNTFNVSSPRSGLSITVGEFPAQ